MLVFFMAQGRLGGKAMATNRQVYRKSNIFGVLIIAVICAIICLATFLAGRSVAAQNEYYTQQEELLKSQIEAEHERTQQIEEYGRYVQSDEYKAYVARKKFGLLYDDEMVFKAGDGRD